MKITSKGQVTIPEHIREEFGLLPHTEVEVRVHRGQVIIEPARTGRRGGKIVDAGAGALGGR